MDKNKDAETPDPQGVLAWLKEWYLTPDKKGSDFWRKYRKSMKERGVDIRHEMKKSTKEARERSEKMKDIRKVDGLNESFDI